MTPYLVLAVIGLLTAIEPVASALAAGCRSQDDVVSWLVSMPMAYIVTLQMRVRCGVGAAMTGLALHWIT
jgi:hypothetical protein